MSFYENLSEFKGLRVVDWTDKSDKIDPAKNAVRLRVEYDEVDDGVSIGDKIVGLLAIPAAAKIQSLIIGSWSPDDSGVNSSDMVEHLVSAREKLPQLRNLFLGDIIGEECEISWIQQSDLSPLLAAYPRLEHLTVRGGEGLTFGTLSHAHLKELVVQTGGLPPSVVHEVAAAKLPALEHLELYLGEPNYGGEATVEDLAPLLRAGLFPKMKYLGIKDSVIQDEIAGVLAIAPVLDQLQTLDLSLGTLGDEGAKALLASPKIRKLKRLDLHHHFISDALCRKLGALGIDVDLSDKQEPHEFRGQEDRFIAVSE